MSREDINGRVVSKVHKFIVQPGKPDGSLGIPNWTLNFYEGDKLIDGFSFAAEDAADKYAAEFGITSFDADGWGRPAKVGK